MNIHGIFSKELFDINQFYSIYVRTRFGNIAIVVIELSILSYEHTFWRCIISIRIYDDRIYYSNRHFMNIWFKNIFILVSPNNNKKTSNTLTINFDSTIRKIMWFMKTPKASRALIKTITINMKYRSLNTINIYIWRHANSDFHVHELFAYLVGTRETLDPLYQYVKMLQSERRKKRQTENNKTPFHEVADTN